MKSAERPANPLELGLQEPEIGAAWERGLAAIPLTAIAFHFPEVTARPPGGIAETRNRGADELCPERARP